LIVSCPGSPWTHYVAQAGFQFMILLLQPPKYWDYRYAQPCLALFLATVSCLGLNGKGWAPQSKNWEFKMLSNQKFLFWESPSVLQIMLFSLLERFSIPSLIYHLTNPTSFQVHHLLISALRGKKNLL
jgi:hypothetical protein